MVAIIAQSVGKLIPIQFVIARITDKEFHFSRMLLGCDSRVKRNIQRFD